LLLFKLLQFGYVTIETENKKKRSWWIPVALFLVLTLVWWRWAPVNTSKVSSPNVQTTEAAVIEEAGTEPQEVLSAADKGAEKPTDIEALEQFKQNTRYPATTRKITPDSHDLLNPGARHENRTKLPGDKNNPNMDWEVLYTADRYFVREKEPLLVSLQLWNKGKPVLPDNVMMVARTINASENTAPVNLATRLDGSARTAVFTPNNHWPDYVGQVRITAEFSAAKLERQSGSLDFFFTSANRIPAIFTGKVSDRIDSGDLLFDIEVDVKSAGIFRIDANLFDSSGLPFGWARFEGNLPVGRAEISLRYYGLLFHDAEAVGPYILKNLHGSRLRPGDSPYKEDMPEPASDYMTSALYELNRFRTDVNNSPRRQRMIEMYEDAIRRGVKLTRPAYTGDG
jgi:hypothetical protein